MFCKLCDARENFDIICETSDFSLVFDNYGLHYGHLLLIPREHVLNLSHARFDLRFVVNVIDAMRGFFNSNIVIYEHGNVSENRTNNISIDHAHLHFLPLSGGVEMIETIIASEATIENTVFQKFYSKKSLEPYHFVSLNGTYSFFTYGVLQSQAFRKAYSLSENIEKWDWKKEGLSIISENSQFANRRKGLKEYLSRSLIYDGIT